MNLPHPNTINLSGQRFGDWLVVGPAPRPTGTQSPGAYWSIKCTCGAIEVRQGGQLRAGRVKRACRKCLGREHLKRGKMSPTYNSWRAMRARCLDPSSDGYPEYGGRGIIISDDWRDNFARFLKDMGERPPHMTLDRKDGDGPYCLNNCRWADDVTQARNSRHFKLTDDQVEEIKQLCTAGVIAREVASLYGVSRGHVAGIKVGLARGLSGDEIRSLRQVTNKPLREVLRQVD